MLFIMLNRMAHNIYVIHKHDTTPHLVHDYRDFESTHDVCVCVCCCVLGEVDGGRRIKQMEQIDRPMVSRS